MFESRVRVKIEDRKEGQEGVKKWVSPDFYREIICRSWVTELKHSYRFDWLIDHRISRLEIRLVKVQVIDYRL